MRLVDAARGRIDRILLTIPGFAVDLFGDALGRVVASLPDDAEVDALVSARAMDAVAPWFGGRVAPSRLHPAPDDLHFSHWAQDALVAAETEDGAPVLLASRRFARYEDARAARLLAEAAGIPLFEIDGALDGGNLLAVGDRLLHGADLAAHNDGAPPVVDATRQPVAIGCAAPAPASETRAAEHLPDSWREVLRIAIPEGSRQPVFHIDLFVAAAGEGRFLVGCPRLGAEALGLPLLDHADADRFDEAAAMLSATGAEVIRNPQPLIWLDDPEEKVRTWLHLPVNNVIVEDAGPGRRTVWLPGFAQAHWAELAPVDQANAEIWRGLGFEVRVVPELLMLAQNRGALNCMCKVAARSQP